MDGEHQGTIGGLGRKAKAFTPQLCTKLRDVTAARTPSFEPNRPPGPSSFPRRSSIGCRCPQRFRESLRSKANTRRMPRLETKVGAALPLSRVEPRANRVDHHRRERDFVIEGVLADPLMEIDREVDRRLAEAFAVFGANARLFFRSATSGASGWKGWHRWRWNLVDARCGLELGFCLARDRVNGYVERPLGRARDDGLWREYQDALEGMRTRRAELRDALSPKIGAAQAAHRRRFKVRHHAIAAMPVSGADKRKLYKMLSLERKAAGRKLRAKIKAWRMASSDLGPGSWKEFLATRAARGDQRAIRRLARDSRAPGIRRGGLDRSPLPARDRRTSRGSIVHNLAGGIRLRESGGSIELLGEPRDDALEQLVTVAKQRLGTKRVTLLGQEDVQRRLAKIAVEHGLGITQERER